MEATRKTLCSAIVVLVAQVAAAEELVIQSFGTDGAMTFGELSNAVAYHVERAAPEGWTNLAAYAATGSGIVTASVTMIDPSMLYRVRAETREPSYLVVDLSGGPEAPAYPVRTLMNEPPDGWTEEHRTTKLVLRRIPAGTFTMGSPPEELGRYANESPHAVTRTRDFHLAVFEVTQAQWNQVMGTWPGYFNNPAHRGSRPVETVSYEDVRGTSAGAGWPESPAVDDASFLGRLREKTGLPGLDLPTEGQWEYACRAGTETALNTGANLTSIDRDPNMDAAGRYWFNGGSTYAQTGDTTAGTPRVGSYPPNAWGLYDLHGGVWEWCLDWYGAYPDAAEEDPGGPSAGPGRVVRGGSWYLFAYTCRSAYRYHYAPSYRNPGLIGFRIALNPE